MLTLYGTKGSGAAAIEAALARAGLAYTAVDAASWMPGPGFDELLRVNPLGQIPTLVLADGTVMTESAAILIHLGLTAAPGCLLPLDASDRARAARPGLHRGQLLCSHQHPRLPRALERAL